MIGTFVANVGANVDPDEPMDADPDQPPRLEVSQVDFEAEVLRSGQPALVEFWAPWSRPCRILEAALDEVAASCAGRVKVVRVNADDDPELSMWYGIESVPTLLYFVLGSVRGRLVGTASKEAILAKLVEVTRGGETASPPTRA